MSQENVEVLHKVYELAEARGVEGLLELATEDIVWVSDPRFPGGGTHRGKENVRRWLIKLWIYDEVSIDVEEIMDLGDRALGNYPLARCPPGRPPGGLAVVPPGLSQGWPDHPGAELPR
jgi:SnoaL-like domain